MHAAHCPLTTGPVSTQMFTDKTLERVVAFFVSALAVIFTWLALFGAESLVALTLVNPGTDLTPAGAQDIASTGLNILVNYMAPLGGLAMLIGAGGSFARNRQSGITAGPSSLGIGGVAMIFAPRMTSELMTSSTAGASFVATMDPSPLDFSPSPVMIGTFLAVFFLWRRSHVARLSVAAK